MSCTDSEGVKTDFPDSYELDHGLSVETIRIRFMVMLHLQEWSYRKIGDLFNCHHERVREIIASSGLCKPSSNKNLK